MSYTFQAAAAREEFAAVRHARECVRVRIYRIKERDPQVIDEERRKD